MIIKEIDENTFNTFAKNHILKNFFQTKEYGNLMKHYGYTVIYVGGYQGNILVAASLVLSKTLGPNIKYGYAPRGFLLDFYNNDLLTSFTKKIKEFFFKRGFAFIKVNPEITYATLNFDEKSKTINTRNKELIAKMKVIGYDKLKDNLYFESLLPKYTPVIHLPSYTFNSMEATLVNTMKNYELSGLRIINGNEHDIETFYNFVKEKESNDLTYFKRFYECFKESDMVDIILCEIDYSSYVKYLQKEYINEHEKNEMLNREFNENPKNNDLYNRKIKSDTLLNNISSAIAYTNKRVQENTFREIIGGAFIVKHQGRITILSAGYNKEFVHVDTKTFIYYKIIDEYKKAGYYFADLYGITADFSDENPYKNLNNFKLKFKPNVYEYIGELDLIVNKPFHQLLWSTNQIQKEFYKPSKKEIN